MIIGAEKFEMPNAPEIVVKPIFCDRTAIKTREGEAISPAVIRYIKENRVDGIIMTPQPHVEQNLGEEWIQFARSENVPVAFMWYDAIIYENIVKELAETNLNIVLDDQHFVCDNQQNILCIYMALPDDPKDPRQERPIDVIFMGNVDCENRKETIYYLLNNGIAVFTVGNQDWNQLNYERLCHFMGQSKISLNFPRNRFTDKTSFKGRILETAMSGGMMIEEENDNTNLFFKPGEEVVWYSTKEELLKTIKHYLKNTEERIRIAENMQKTCLEKYTIANWWKKVIEKFKQKKIRIKMY